MGRHCLAIDDIQFLQNSMNVILDGADLDRGPLGGLPVAQSLADENQASALRCGECDRSVRLSFGSTTALCQLCHTQQECSGNLK
jgi:hypothetical protein